MKQEIQRIGVIALVCLVLAQSIVVPFATQNVAAQSAGEDDEPWSEELAEIGCKAEGILIPYVPKCNVEYGDVDGATADQVHWDVYSDAVFMADSRKQTIEEKMSYFEQSQGIALAEAKMELVRCMNEGKSQAICEDRARERVTEVFTTVQKSLYISQNRQMKHWQMMSQQINQTDNLKTSETYPYESNTADWTTEFRQVEVTLYNGEKMTVTAGAYEYISGDGGDHIYAYPYYYNGKIDRGNQGDSFGSQVNTAADLNVISPDSKTTVALEGDQYKQALTTLDSKHQSALDAVHPMANSIYSNYDPGEVSVQETQGPLETILTSATNDDPLTYRLKSAAVSGYAVSDGGETVKVKADFNGDNTISEGETKTGVIYAQDGAFPNNKFATTTYEKSDTNGSVTFLSNPDGSSPQSYEIGDQKFVVLEIYTDSGTANSMELSTNDFSTTDTTSLNKQINEIEQKLEKLEQSYGSDSLLGGSGAGGLLNGLLSGLSLGVGILVVLGVLLLVIKL